MSFFDWAEQCPELRRHRRAHFTWGERVVLVLSVVFVVAFTVLFT